MMWCSVVSSSPTFRRNLLSYICYLLLALYFLDLFFDTQDRDNTFLRNLDNFSHITRSHIPDGYRSYCCKNYKSIFMETDCNVPCTEKEVYFLASINTRTMVWKLKCSQQLNFLPPSEPKARCAPER
jgi:hypothetical protein